MLQIKILKELKVYAQSPTLSVCSWLKDQAWHKQMRVFYCNCKNSSNQMHTRVRQIFFLSLPFLFKLSKLVIYCKYFCQFRWWSLAHWKASVHKGRVCLLNKGWEMFRVKNEKTRKNVFSEWPRRIFLRFVLFKCSTGN